MFCLSNLRQKSTITKSWKQNVGRLCIHTDLFKEGAEHIQYDFHDEEDDVQCDFFFKKKVLKQFLHCALYEGERTLNACSLSFFHSFDG